MPLLHVPRHDKRGVVLCAPLSCCRPDEGGQEVGPLAGEIGEALRPLGEAAPIAAVEGLVDGAAGGGDLELELVESHGDPQVKAPASERLKPGQSTET